jgi:hypothetical protein
MELALGCAPHTGWAVVVLVAGDARQPVVLDRRRVVLCPEDHHRQIYHHAQALPIAKAAAAVRQVERAVEAQTTGAVEELAKAAAEHGELVAVGIVGRPREVPPLEQVLASHSLLHLAEGELYRGALDEAARWQGLQVAMAPPKHTVAEVAAAIGTPAGPFAERLTALRAELGAPWQADHRAATAAGLLALGPR